MQKLNSTYNNRSNYLSKFVERNSANGNIRRTSWLHKIALAGKILTIPKNNEEKSLIFANQIDSMITVLNSRFGDNWDFKLEPVFRGTKFNENTFNEYYNFRGFKLHCILHFPELEISNSQSLSRTFENLFVTFCIEDVKVVDETVFSCNNLRGCRSSMEFDEWFKGYMHSHLPTHKPQSHGDCFYLSSFCLGDGTEIRDISESLMTAYTIEMFEMYLLTIDSLVRWESIEGVPHTKMKNINVGESVSEVSMSDESHLRIFFRELNERINELDVDFVFSEGRYKIKQNSKFERMIHHIVSEKIPRRRKKILVIKENGNYYGYNHPDIVEEEQLKRMFLNSSGETPSFTFRDKTVEFKVKPFNGELPDINNYKVHPKFLEYAATKLEQQLYYKTVRKSVIERHYQDGDARRNIDENQVLV